MRRRRIAPETNVDAPTPHDDGMSIVPLVDDRSGERIYDASLLVWSLMGAAAGAIAGAIVGLAIGSNWLPVAGLGQFAAAGAGVAAFTAAGIGAAAGWLVGGLAAIFRIPARTHPKQPHEDERDESRSSS